MRSFLDTAIQVFDFFISTEESLRHELPLTLLSLSLAIISLKILSLRAKYEHFRFQSGLLVTRSIIFTDLKLLISNAWKLEVFWYLAVFYSSLNLFLNCLNSSSIRGLIYRLSSSRMKFLVQYIDPMMSRPY